MTEGRIVELTPSWMASVLVRFDLGGVAEVLAGPGAVALRATVHVLTSQAPMGEDQPPEREAELLAELLASVGADPPGPWQPVVGCDPSSGHAELGVGIVGHDRSRAAALGLRWDQLAIYELSDGELRVVRSQPPGLGEVEARGPRRWDGPAMGGIGPDLLAAWWAAFRTAGLPQR
jgi:hypothetical protein